MPQCHPKFQKKRNHHINAKYPGKIRTAVFKYEDFYDMRSTTRGKSVNQLCLLFLLVQQLCMKRHVVVFQNALDFLARIKPPPTDGIEIKKVISHVDGMDGFADGGDVGYS